jgi:CRP-like cAMP-binding protein
MFIDQADLFRHTSSRFIQRVMQIERRVLYQQGDFVFREGDPAGCFFVLLDGCVRIHTSEDGHTVHIVNRSGEAFGWSSLVNRPAFSASAQCTAPSTLLIFDRQHFGQIIDQEPADGVVFFKNLAQLLGHRLLQTYRRIGVDEKGQAPGTGQFQQAEAV